jgi:hypothetical protein
MTAGQPDAETAAIRAAVDRGGVYLQFVPQPTVLETCWYTVGLTGRGLPELIVFGLPPDLARPALRDLADDLVTGRREIGAGQRADDVLAGHPARFVAVTEADRHLPAAARFYAGAAVRALQLVWPDRHERWPWQIGTHVADMPVLGEHT